MVPSREAVRWSLHPAYPFHLPVYLHPSCTLSSYRIPRSRPGRWTLVYTAVRATMSPYPRGPRSGPGCVVPVPQRLLDPIRPTRRHIATSLHSSLYAMPSLCGCAEATHEWFRAFADRSFSTCRPQRPREVRRLPPPSPFADDAGLHPWWTGSTLPKVSRFGAPYWFARATTCRVARLRYETCTSGLSMGRSPFPSPGMTTVSDWAISTGETFTHWNVS